ncbi:ATP-binding cassette domain-containing protein [Streptomyces sp. NPDC000983]|uniref:ATP-binding cassette domain-containing protein n=1 Tax=Streptomyces sp. NPDC000983 TaxID=3154373 RepID=UPI00332D8400
MTEDLVAEIRDLRVEIDGRALVDGVNLRVRRGTVTALVGASGSGKTTTGLALLGEYPPGSRVTGSVRHTEGGRVGYVPQHPAAVLNPARRVGALLHDIARTHAGDDPRPARERVLGALADAQLPDAGALLRRHPHQLSGGQQQRVVLAQALLLGARVVVADEPTTGQDPEARARITDRFAAVASGGIAVVLLTHDLDVVRALADEVLVLRAGRVVESGPPERLWHTPRHAWTRALLDAADAAPARPALTGRAGPAGTVPGARSGAAGGAAAQQDDDPRRAAPGERVDPTGTPPGGRSRSAPVRWAPVRSAPAPQGVPPGTSPGTSPKGPGGAAPRQDGAPPSTAPAGRGDHAGTGDAGRGDHAGTGDAGRGDHSAPDATGRGTRPGGVMGSGGGWGGPGEAREDGPASAGPAGRGGAVGAVSAGGSGAVPAAAAGWGGPAGAVSPGRGVGVGDDVAAGRGGVAGPAPGGRGGPAVPVSAALAPGGPVPAPSGGPVGLMPAGPGGGGEAGEAREGGDPAGVVLEVRGLVAAHRGVVVLRVPRFVVRGGECVAVVGRSGSGKSTLGRCLAGLHREYEGAVLLDGDALPRSLRRRDRDRLAAVQYVFQDARAAFDEARPVLDQVARTAVRLRGADPRPARDEALALLERLGLAEVSAHRRPGGLSGGELQRAALARALLARPRVLICDEITSGLDTVTRRGLLTLLHGLKEEPDGPSLVLITHDAATARLADRNVLVEAGHVVDGAPGPAHGLL